MIDDDGGVSTLMVLGITDGGSGVLFGAAYYAEYHRTDRVDEDFDLMKAAGFTVVRVGESVWSTWEPRDGEFELDWLAPVLDAAWARGIRVVLGTPTYAVPPWLQVKHPEIAAETGTGRRVPWGARQEIDYTHPEFRRHAERVIRAVAARYADHPAVIGYQVDNEPGLHLLHNRTVFEGFLETLQKEYGDVETLNREWGLTYWSHRITEWRQLWAPDGNTLPQYDLAWRRYQASVTTDFIAWQAAIVREYARPGQFVTTCISYPRPAVDDRTVTLTLDVAAGNPYYGMQHQLDATADDVPTTPWITSGVAGLLRQADRLYSSKQARFLVTETNAQSIGESDFNQAPYPGQLAQAALALVSRGAAMVEYWHWHTLPYGTETYWGGVLPHSLVPGRVYDEVAALGSRLTRIGETLDGFEPDADVAILWSNDSRFALDFTPPFPGHGGQRRGAYERIVDTFHRGVVDAGGQARILHVEQARELGARALVTRYPVLVAPGLYVATDADLDLLTEYAEVGGHLVLGVRTGYADEEARARVAVAPGRLREAAGVHYSEFSTLDGEVAVRSAGSFHLSEGATGREWSDGLVVDDATVLARYEHPFFGRFAAVTTRDHGAGRITTVGTLPSRTLAADLFRWAMPTRNGDRLAPERDLPVTVGSGALPDGRTAWFVFNWGWTPTHVALARDVVDLDTGDALVAGRRVPLDAWSALTLVDR